MRARAKAAKKENAERWLLTYADLITLLMVFFVLLYSMSTTDARKYEDLTGALKKAFNNSMFEFVMPNGPNGPVPSSAAPQKTVARKEDKHTSKEQKDYQTIKAEVAKIMQQQGLGQGISVNAEPSGIRISFYNNILFAPGEDTLKPGGEVILHKIATLLAGLPNNVQVQGHTDDNPIHNYAFPTNWELSALRAVTVVRFLTEAAGVNPVRLAAIGYAQYHPLTSNATVAGRARNRRVDMLILYTPAGSSPSLSMGASASAAGAKK